jgi:hypothetical protein
MVWVDSAAETQALRLTIRQCSDLTRELAAGKDGVFENRDRLTQHPVDLGIHIKYGRMGATHVAQPVGQG